MNATQEEDSSDVIMGNLPVNDVPAKVLFDTGALHCFISRPFASKHGWFSQVMHKPLAVVSPGRCLLANHEIPDISIMMGDFKFLASPMVLGNSILILFSEWIGFLSTRLSLIVQPARFN